MKAKILLLFLLIQSASYTQETWRPIGDDDFNRASCGTVRLAGRNPIVIKNEHVFLFNMENPDYQSTNSHFSIGKYNGSQWEHIGLPFLFSNNTPTIDCAVDNNEIPYVLFNDIAGSNLPIVKKFESGSWVDVGTGISNSSSSFFNISMGSDNLPRILFREGNTIKLKEFDGSNWILLSETTEFIPYTSISLVLDNNNVPYVLTNYQVGTTYNCFVKKFNGTAWEEVGITGFAEQGKSLVFDNFNVPHMFVGTTIKKFNGSGWENFSTPLSGFFPVSVVAAENLFFDNSNDLYASFLGYYYMGTNSMYVKKLVSGTWQPIVSNGFASNKIYTVSGDSLYHVYFGPDIIPEIIKTTAGITTFLGGSSFQGQSPNFSICNGIPMVAYLVGSYTKPAVRMYVDDSWTILGSPEISDNQVRKVVVKSGTDGKIYAAYNNVLSSTISDTKITVKQLTSAGWQPVGPENFSLSAGELFDFKLSHLNEPYVLYMSGRVQKFNGSNWVFIGGSAYTGDVESRLALDSNDVPYIAYKDWSNNGHIAVKRLNGSVWEYVDQAGLAYAGQQYCWSPTIAFDSSNNLYMGFADYAHRIHIKKLNDGVWESIGNEFFTTGTTNQYEIAVDRNDVVYVVYNELEDNFRARAKVKRFNGTDWEFVGEGNFSANTIRQGTIDFSENNTPIVSYDAEDSNSVTIHTKYFGQENSLGINNPILQNQTDAVVSPNPVKDVFSINSIETVNEIIIYNILGKKVFHQKGTSLQSINITSLSTGLYIVKVKTENGVSSLKIVKQ